MSTATIPSAKAAEQAEKKRQFIQEIKTAIKRIHPDPTDIFEIRALNVPGRGKPYIASGYFDGEHLDAAAEAAFAYSFMKKAAGVYTTLNRCNPALFARAPNCMKDFPAQTTTDSEVLQRNWLFIDIDPHRPSGVAASEPERQAAAELAEIIVEKLRAFGFPYPLFADSGNGQYELYRVELPNDDGTTKLIRDFYTALNNILPRISTEPYATIDTAVYNAGRMARIGGTVNRKGDSIPDRPHRQAHLHEPAEGDEIEVVSREAIEAVAALAAGVTIATAGKNAPPTVATAGKIDVPLYCSDYGVKIRETKQDAGRTIYILETCPFDPNHGRNGETSIVQADSGLTTFHCKHDSCQSYKWADFKARVGNLEPRHLGKQAGKTRPAARLEPGTRVQVKDRGNFGEIVADHGTTYRVHFVSPERQHAEKDFPESQVRTLDGRPVVESDEPPIPPPCSLRELVASHPALRPAVIGGLLRVGETMNIVAAPKRGKSWLANSLALSVASGCDWLDTFPCTRGRVLLLDAELHPEVIAHRLPAVADAMTIGSEYLDSIDVLALRGLGIDLLKLRSFIESIEPGRYALIILDAWYRFLPLGFSENDNAQVMRLYNQIDSYTAALRAAWINIHHASKGDQSGKGTTDVGSGAGSQSRAADTHLIIRQHEQDDVAVIEAAVRSWPPVAPLAIRWTFPTWQLDTEADPRRLQKPRERSSRESKDAHLDADRQSIVNVMVHDPDLQTKTEIRDSARVGNPRFGFAWASLLADKTIIPSSCVVKGNNRRYESFTLSHQEIE